MAKIDPIFPESTKRIAVFSDIHGNKQALNAVLNDIAARGIKDVVCNGDLITSSAQSDYVTKQIKTLGIPVSRGNHERYLLELENPNDEKWFLDNWAVTRYEFEHLDAAIKSWLYGLPAMLCLVAGEHPLFMTHGAPGNDRANLTAKLSRADWAQVFKPFPEQTTLIGSHLHRFWRYKETRHQFIRTPSAGLPLDKDTRAGYCIFEHTQSGWTAEECRVSYDIEKELRDFKASEFYKVGGVFSHLLWLELKTAEWWILPFFRHLAKVLPHNEQRLGFTHDEMNAAWQSFDQAAYSEYSPDL